MPVTCKLITKSLSALSEPLRETLLNLQMIMLKKITQLILVSIISLTSLSAQSSLEGKWNTGEENTIIQTYEKDGAWYGKILSSDNANAKIGTVILQGFKQDGDVWKGKLYAVKRDKLMDAEISTATSTLNITISVSFMTKKLKWKRE